MRKGLREISQRFAAGAGLLRIQAEVVRVTEHPLEYQPRFVQSNLIHPPGARERFDEPEGTDVERPLGAFDPVARLIRVVAIDQAVRDPPALLGRFIDRLES